MLPVDPIRHIPEGVVRFSTVYDRDGIQANVSCKDGRKYCIFVPASVVKMSERAVLDYVREYINNSPVHESPTAAEIRMKNEFAIPPGLSSKIFDDLHAGITNLMLGQAPPSTVKPASQSQFNPVLLLTRKV